MNIRSMGFLKQNQTIIETEQQQQNQQFLLRKKSKCKPVILQQSFLNECLQIFSISARYQPLDLGLVHVMVYLGYFVVFTLMPFNEYQIVTTATKLEKQKLLLIYCCLSAPIKYYMSAFKKIFVRGKRTKGHAKQSNNSLISTSIGKQFAFNISVTFDSVFPYPHITYCFSLLP